MRVRRRIGFWGDVCGGHHLPVLRLSGHDSSTPFTAAKAPMKNLFVFLTAICATQVSAQAPRNDMAALEQRAQNVTIIRDDWGIPHVYGKTDADVVFGVIY